MAGHYKTPCERCGVLQSSQFCVDCRLVDPEMTAGSRNARQQERFLIARRRVATDADLWEWAHQYVRNGGTSERRPA